MLCLFSTQFYIDPITSLQETSTMKRTLYQCKVDVDMPNTVNSVLADALL